MELNNIYVVNPQYLLKEDKNRVIFCNRSLKKISPGNISEDYIAFIHPLQAIMLSYFNGTLNMNEVIQKISGDFNIPRHKTQKLLERYVENENEFCISDGTNDFYFPKNVLVKKEQTGKYYSYKPEDFNLSDSELDFETSRLNKPLDILLITNLNCRTNCIYCYADRKTEYKPLSLSAIYNIIEQAAKLQIREFDVNGGEFLLYPNWERIITKLNDCGYSPYISTKLPLIWNTILKIKNLGLDTIQISIDSLKEEELSFLLRVSSEYKNQIIRTITELDKENIVLHTNSIITKYNCSRQGVISLLNFLTSLRNIKQINISAAGYSMYIPSDEYQKLKPSEEDLLKINDLVNEYSLKNPNIEINFASYVTNEEINGSKSVKEKLFQQRSFCTANNTGIIILPDGKVTICEELYWNKNFIIGDVNKTSIMDIWNSEQALNLHKLSRDLFSDDSYCQKCSELDECIRKSRCWKIVLMAYGQENWDYPDPRCPYAPEVKNEIYHV